LEGGAAALGSMSTILADVTRRSVITPDDGKDPAAKALGCDLGWTFYYFYGSYRLPSLLREDQHMSRRFVAAIFCLGVALFLMPQVFSLAAEDHIAEAITHTKQAIDHGKQGHAEVLTTHAEAALTHAEAGEKAKANPHTEEAIKHLNQAIDEGKKGDAKLATTHAEAALTHLQQAQ
jgi:hypothetical protein